MANRELQLLAQLQALRCASCLELSLDTAACPYNQDICCMCCSDCM